MNTVRFCILWAATSAVASYPTRGVADDTATDPELAWAKRVATEFFDDALSDEKSDVVCGSALTFLVPDLAAELKEHPLEGPMSKLFWQYGGGHFQIKSAELSPSKSEVILNCELDPPPRLHDQKPQKKSSDDALAIALLGQRQDKPSDVTLWMVRDGEGHWMIRFIRAAVEKAAAK